jgi:hypothetical protein
MIEAYLAVTSTAGLLGTWRVVAAGWDPNSVRAAANAFIGSGADAVTQACLANLRVLPRSRAVALAGRAAVEQWDRGAQTAGAGFQSGGDVVGPRG